MSLLIEEFEPILSATEAARSLPKASPSSKNEEKELLSELRLNRVAMMCMTLLCSIDRSLYRLGRCVSKLVRHHDRERGLAALSAYIRKQYGKVVSSQRLGQARLVFETFDRDEYENRISYLTNTHLLKVAQAFPELSPGGLKPATVGRVRTGQWLSSSYTSWLLFFKPFSWRIVLA